MPANNECAFIIDVFADEPYFDEAARQAFEQMDESERPLCAGAPDYVGSPGHHPVVDIPSGYYVVTTMGIHFGVLLKAKGFLSKARSENVFVSRFDIKSFQFDPIGWLELLGSETKRLVAIGFTEDRISYQFFRDRFSENKNYISSHPRTVDSIL